jgi:TM2 domain-containing membrane protein YozV
MSEYNRAKKSTTVAVLLALFLGGFGAHRFYLNKIISGVIYILFFWTFIPAIIALIECFLMSGTIKKYNEGKAIEISQKVKIGFPSENS